MKKKKPKCDCADVIGRNQVCDICQSVADKGWEGYLKKEYPPLKEKKPYPGKDGEFYLIKEYPPISWELYPFCNDKYVTITLPKAPNIFYRWMMTLFFGFRWKRIK